MSTGVPRPIQEQSPTYLAILQMSVEHPLLGPQQIAGLLQRPLRQVMHIMASDHFLEERARMIMQTYGDKITGIRGKVLDTAADAIEAIRQRIADPRSDVAPETLLKAAEFLMKFIAAPVGQEGAAQPGAQATVNVVLSAADVERAKEVRSAHINAIPLPARAIAGPKEGSEV